VRPWSLALLAVGSALAVPAAAPAVADTFRDPLDAPAPPTRLASATQSTGLARVGDRRVVAVGVRGLIIVSDDGGETWTQVPAPVSSDLLTVRFVDGKHGWAGGHDGVVLATRDGGDSWEKLLDGRQTGPLLVDHLTKLAAAGDAEVQPLLRDVKRNFENGPEMPVLDLWFEDTQHGWAVGPFGTAVGTTDGGRTWQSWVEKVDNPKMLHYHAIRAIDGDVYMPSEQGIVFKLDRERLRFEALQTGYAGSFFGVVGAREFILAYGLRGTIYRSRDRGATWERVPTDFPATLTGATVLDDGRLVFVSQDGRAMVTADQANTFEPLRPARPTLFTDVVQVSRDRVVVSGLSGVQVVPLN
jgi:photosystem II stability/assembly factor-like uncharacterized protein